MTMRTLGVGSSALPCLLALFLISGCTVRMGPSHAHNPAKCRSRIDTAILDHLKHRNATPEDILLALGEPDDSGPDRLEYRWVEARGTTVPNFLGGVSRVDPFEWQTNSFLIKLGAGGKFAGWKFVEGPWMPWTQDR